MMKIFETFVNFFYSQRIETLETDLARAKSNIASEKELLKKTQDCLRAVLESEEKFTEVTVNNWNFWQWGEKYFRRASDGMTMVTSDGHTPSVVKTETFQATFESLEDLEKRSLGSMAHHASGPYEEGPKLVFPLKISAIRKEGQKVEVLTEVQSVYFEDHHGNSWYDNFYTYLEF
jgi:hypothetical protein